MLQPAVEAFFLVHATERESKPPVRDTRESQLAHIKDEPPPLSPAPLTPATPSSLDPFFSREPSSMHISSSLPPDTQKFLRFAGTGNSQTAPPSKFKRLYYVQGYFMLILFSREGMCACVYICVGESDPSEVSRDLLWKLLYATLRGLDFTLRQWQVRLV